MGYAGDNWRWSCLYINAMVIFWSTGNSWVATIGLATILFLMLLGGAILLILGLLDLVRDLLHFLHERSHHDQHASA